MRSARGSRPAQVGRICLVVVCLLCCASAALSDDCTARGGFIENRGQADGPALYYVISPYADVYFESDGVTVLVKADWAIRGIVWESAAASTGHRTLGVEDQRRAVRIGFGGATGPTLIEPRGELVTRYNYFRGRDPRAWRTNVPAYREIVYHDLWPGVDVEYRMDDDGIHYRVLVEPWADPARANFVYDEPGGWSSRADATDRLDAQAGASRSLWSWQADLEGTLISRAGWGTAAEGDAVGRDNPDALVWSTFLGAGNEELEGLDVDDSGSLIVTGYASSGFPMTPAAYDTSYNGGGDIFVSKLSPDGESLLWSTYLGGVELDMIQAMALDDAGNPVLAGQTESPDFPVTSGAYDTTFAGGLYEDEGDVFVTKLSATGDNLVWSTFMGGTRGERAEALSLDADGNIVMAGGTSSQDFPVTAGAYDETPGGVESGFVSKLDATGSDLLWSTFLGGDDGSSWPCGVCLDMHANPVVAGFTTSPDHPVTHGAYDETLTGYEDIYVSKLSADGGSLLWSTFLGGDEVGTGGEGATALVLDSSGNAVLCGYTEAPDFPVTPGAYDTVFNGRYGGEGFVTKVSSDGTSLVWSTFLGGLYGVCMGDVDLDDSDNPAVIGETSSPDFPVTPGAFDSSLNGESDAFVTMLNEDGTGLLWSSFLGGSDYEYCDTAIRVGDRARVSLAGVTFSPDFPTTPGAYDTTGWWGTGGDAGVFVASLQFEPDTTAVQGCFYAAVDSDSAVSLRWTVASLAGIEGFNVYRSVSSNGPLVLINEDPLPPMSPGSYEDSTVWPETTFWYELRAVLAGGVEDVVGSGLVSATTGGTLSTVLHLAGPNPFADETSLQFDVPGHLGSVSLSVYNARGQLVKELVDGPLERGRHSARWDGRDAQGIRAASGVYFVRLETDTIVRTARMVLMR